MNLREVLQAYLDHRHDPGSPKNFRLGKIEHRLEILTVISSRISISMK